MLMTITLTQMITNSHDKFSQNMLKRSSIVYGIRSWLYPWGCLLEKDVVYAPMHEAFLKRNVTHEGGAKLMHVTLTK